MNILIVDNNDSFTYNILELLRKNIVAKINVVRYDEIEISQISNFNKIIISPGPGLPDDFPTLQKIIDEYKSSKSILGICLGHQAICSFFGAKLVNLPLVCHGQSHRIQVDTTAKIYQKLPHIFNVGLYHSWAIDNNGFPEDLQITGLSEAEVIMSMAHKIYDIHGIQYHPESFISEYGAEILKNFIEQ